MARRGTFGFDISKPIKMGRLLKQGYFHKAFKFREFILYPGFLVYYNNANDWKLDITKGDTLGSRIGALKLKGATVRIARNAPKACKFGLVVTAPDPSNKRQLYLMNAASKEERDAWIDAINQALPVSTQQNRKELTPKSKEEPETESCYNDALPHLTYVERQNTEHDAAVEVATHTDPEEEQREVDEVSSSVSDSLNDIEKILHKRCSTTIMASLILEQDQKLLKGVEADMETSIDLVLSQTRPQQCDGKSDDTSIIESICIDDICVTDSTSSRDGSVSTDSTSRVTSLASELSGSMPFDDVEHEHLTTSLPESSTDAVQDIVLESHESIKWSQDDTGKATETPVTSMGFAFIDSSKSERRNHGKNGDAAVKAEEENEKLDGEKDKVTSSSLSSQPDVERVKSSSFSISHVLLNDTAPRLSLNIYDFDSDNTMSGEESISDLTMVIPPEQTVETEKAGEGEITNGTPPLVTTDTHLGSITIKEDRTGSSSDSSGGSYGSNHSSPRASLTASATPFIEKRGFLYKMGGHRKNWRPRFFVLHPGIFRYYKDSSCRKLLGEVKLNKLSIFYPGVGERTHSFQFKVHTESSWNRRPDYILAAQSEREMKEWIAAFKSAGQKINPALSPRDNDN